MKNKKLFAYTNHLAIERIIDRIEEELHLLKSGLLSISIIDEIVKSLSLCENIINETSDKSELAKTMREMRLLLLNQIFNEKFLSQDFIDSMIKKIKHLERTNLKQLIGDTSELSFKESITQLKIDSDGMDDLFGRMWTNVTIKELDVVLSNLKSIGVSIDKSNLNFEEIDREYDLLLIDVETLVINDELSSELIKLKTPTILINTHFIKDRASLKENYNLLFWEFDKQHLTTLELICLNVIELHKSHTIINTFSKNMMYMFSTIDSILQVLNESEQIDNIKNEFKKILIHKKRSKEKYLRFIGHKSA